MIPGFQHNNVGNVQEKSKRSKRKNNYNKILTLDLTERKPPRYSVKLILLRNYEYSTKTAPTVQYIKRVHLMSLVRYYSRTQ